MRSSLLAVISLALFGFGSPVLAADDKPADKPAEAATKGEKPAKAGKPVTLKGTMTCGKCALNETDKCQNVLKVGKAGKEEKYYLAANDISEKSHETVCSGEAKATVKGTVSEDAGKKVLTASSIKYQ